MSQTRTMRAKKRIALIAHDGMKQEMLDWTKQHADELGQHELFATGTTGQLLREQTGLDVHRFQSGPLGGDQQIGARIVEGELDMLVFFWDPLEQQPHDPDVKALLRIAVLHNIPTASNLATADFLLSSSYIQSTYERALPNFTRRIRRDIA